MKHQTPTSPIPIDERALRARSGAEGARSATGAIDWLSLRRAANTDRAWELDEGRFWGLAFSRDGEQLAYAAHENGSCELRIVTAEGRGMRVAARMSADELVSEVHGFSRDDRYLVYTIARSGRDPEIWAVDLLAVSDNDVTAQRMARGFFFGGFADDPANDGIFVWDRATGERRTYRVGFEGDVVPLRGLKLGATCTLSPDGRVYTAVKRSAADEDRRFTLVRSNLDGSERESFAEISTSCRTQRIAVRCSPDGAFLHLTAIGTIEPDPDADISRRTEMLSFDLVLSADGELRRQIAVKGWASHGRAVIAGPQHSLSLIDVKTGVVTPFVDESVDHFSVSRSGARCAYVSGRRLMLTSVPD